MKPDLPRAATLLLAAITGSALAAPVSSVVTYQGVLRQSGVPVTDVFDFKACLYDTANGVTPQTCAADFAAPVENGLFTLPLDFGPAAFAGDARFLELQVRPHATGGNYTTLPRQPLTAAPESLHALSAPWNGLQNLPAGFADGVDNVGGTMSNFTAGFGLTGGTVVNAGTVAVDPAVMQRRVASCNSGEAIRAVGETGAVTCVAVAGSSSGTVQQVTAGVGLAASGGANGNVITTTGTLSIANQGVGLAQIDATQVQARVTGVCPDDEYMAGVNEDGSVACRPLAPELRISTVDDRPVDVVGTDLSLALGADGFPVISYFNSTANSLNVAKCGNSACSVVDSLTEVMKFPNQIIGRFSSIAVPADGLPVIAFTQQAGTTVDVMVMKCDTIGCTGDNNVEFGMSGALVGNSIRSLDMVTDEASLPFIAMSGQIAVFASRCGTSTCSNVGAPIQVSDLRLGSLPGLALFRNTASFPVFAVKSLNGFEFVACQDDACTTSTRQPLSIQQNQLQASIRLALDASGVPVFTVADASLRAVKCANAACSGAITVSALAAAPANHGFLLPSDGLPVIAHWSANSLDVTKCSVPDCSAIFSTTQVDVNSGVGGRIAMKATPGGIPIIAYADTNQGSLKVAKCGTKSCE